MLRRHFGGAAFLNEWRGPFSEEDITDPQLTCEELLTVLLELEAVLNIGPLSYVSTEDLKEPLTPSQLISGRRVLSCPTIGPDDVDAASVTR